MAAHSYFELVIVAKLYTAEVILAFRLVNVGKYEDPRQDNGGKVSECKTDTTRATRGRSVVENKCRRDFAQTAGRSRHRLNLCTVRLVGCNYTCD